MALTHEEVKKIAVLARLRFTPEEEATFVHQLGAIVDYIDQIQSFETGDTDIASAPSLREAADVVHDCLPRELFLANAPAHALGEFLVVPEVKGGGDGGGGDGDA